MTLLFLCGVWRVMLVAGYFTLILAARPVAEDLLVPAALLTLAVAVYDAVDGYRRQS